MAYLLFHPYCSIILRICDIFSVTEYYVREYTVKSFLRLFVKTQ